MRKTQYFFLLLFSCINISASLQSIDDIYVDHDGEAWLKQYEKAETLIKSKKAEDRSLGLKRKKTLLCDIFRDTKWAILYGFLVDDDEVRLDNAQIAEMQQNTQVFHELSHIPSLRSSNIATKVSVYNESIVDIARAFLKKYGRSPLVLNMAHTMIPGGKVEVGSEGHEESLFRRSTYYKALMLSENSFLKKQFKDGQYRIPEFGTIYTPQVAFFRLCQKDGFSFCSPFYLDIAAQAAYDLNSEPRDAPRIYEEYEANIKEKIRAILRTAYATKHSTLVLGAYGCGLQKNSPVTMSRLFKEVFQEVEFQGVFLEIAFAITDEATNDNYTQFKNTLHGLRV